MILQKGSGAALDPGRDCDFISSKQHVYIAIKSRLATVNGRRQYAVCV